MALDHLLLLAGLYFGIIAVGVWWLGIRSFLRRYSGTPSPRWWGPAFVEDYFQIRQVSGRLRWTPFRLRVFELLLLLSGGLLVAGALLHYGWIGG
jgi:hypothetical protein